MIRIFLCSIIMVLFVSAAAMAVPMTWTDTIDFNPDVRISPLNGKSYFHNITDNGFKSALNSGNDTISGYSLKVSIFDDNDRGAESAIVWTLGGTHSYDFAFSSQTYEGGILGVIDILDDGTLNVSVSSLWGDFFLGASELKVFGDDGEAPPPPPLTHAPEPGSLILMGSGLIGVALCGRRRFLRKH